MVTIEAPSMESLGSFRDSTIISFCRDNDSLLGFLIVYLYEACTIIMHEDIDSNFTILSYLMIHNKEMRAFKFFL